MKPNTGYILEELNKIPYLLPYGQNIADHRRGIRLNETGAFLWNALQETQDKDELLRRLAVRYDADEEDLPVLRQDLNQFLNLLSAYGIIIKTRKHTSETAVPAMVLKIAGLRIHLYGPEEAFSEQFSLFEAPYSDDGVPPDLTVTVLFGTPAQRENGVLRIRNHELIICEREEDELLFFPQAPNIKEAHLLKDGSRITFYCIPPLKEPLPTDLFHAIRLAFLYLAQKRGMYAIHSVSVLYREKAWLFAGHSGIGKTTHSRLWEKLYQTPVINGDLNLMTLTGDGPLIHGIPWCGTSGICDVNTWPLGGIILLGRSDRDICDELPVCEQQLQITQRLISPSWTPEQLRQNLHFCGALIQKIPVCKAHCTKEPSAAGTVKAWVDKSLDL